MAKGKKRKKAVIGPASPEPTGTTAPAKEKAPARPEAAAKSNDSLREFVEAVVMAFILAFLFRTFEAEAFVIPTGSMAPTLFGRHKDVTCEKCQLQFEVGASDEINKLGTYMPGQRINTAICPNCRYENAITDEPVYNGDRILVNKFTYELSDPERWDVIVFKYPEESTINYIKRLVGLPGEAIRILHGDVYARTDDNDPWQILRKQDPDKQRVLQQLVYDNNNPPKDLLEAGWPERWAAVQSGSEGGVAGWSEDDRGWQSLSNERAFTVDLSESDDDFRWIRYRHFVPTQSWSTIPKNPQPQLIADFCSYNAYVGGDNPNGDNGVFWVGDLTVSAKVDLEEISSSAEIPAVLLLELVEGGRIYQCRIDLRTGQATLSLIDAILSETEVRDIATGKTDLKNSGSFDICFANVDDRLCLWVDDDLVPLTKVESPEFANLKAGEYHPPAAWGPSNLDMTPVGIAARGAKVKVSDLVLQRDIYYRSEKVEPVPNGDGTNVFIPDNESSQPAKLKAALSNPAQWYSLYMDDNSGNPHNVSDNYNGVEFEALGPDEFFVMGDNSPRSQDSRLWSNTRNAERRHAVPREALVGKGFFIYWPHGIPFLNDGKGIPVTYHDQEKQYPRFRVPFYPQWWRWFRIR